MLRLKFERTYRQISQHRLACVAGLHQPQLSQIERGRLRPTPQELQRLSEALGVEPAALLRDVAMLGASR